MKIVTNPELNPPFWAPEQLLNDWNSEVLIWMAGQGSFKSFYGHMKLLLLHIYNSYTIDGKNTNACTFAMQPTHSMLRDISWPTIQKIAGMMNLTVTHKRKDNQIIIHELSYKDHPSVIMLRSAEAGTTLRGFNDCCAGIFDEPAKYPQGLGADDPIVQGLGRLGRTPARFVQALMVGTPEGYDTEFHRRASAPLRPGYRLIRSSLEDNPLQKDYVLRIKKEYPAELWPCFIGGMAVNLSGQKCYSFDRRFNVNNSMHYDLSQPLHIACDFGAGVGNYMILGQQLNGICYAFDEIHRPKLKTEKMMEILKQFLKVNNLPFKSAIVFGDPAGRSDGQSAASQTDYMIIMEHLRAAGINATLDIRKKAPLQRDRVNLANIRMINALTGERSYFINSLRCPQLLADYETVTWDETGMHIQKSEKYSHASDADTYRLFQLYKPSNTPVHTTFGFNFS